MADWVTVGALKVDLNAVVAIRDVQGVEAHVYFSGTPGDNALVVSPADGQEIAKLLDSRAQQTAMRGVMNSG